MIQIARRHGLWTSDPHSDLWGPKQDRFRFFIRFHLAGQSPLFHPKDSGGGDKFCLYLAATMANLTLLADKSGLTGDPDPELCAGTAVVRADVDCSTNRLDNLVWPVACLTSPSLIISPFPKRTFRLSFQVLKFG